MQADNGKKFNNRLLNDFYIKNEIKIIIKEVPKEIFFSKDIKLFESVKEKLKNSLKYVSDKINPIEENYYALLSERYNKKGNKLAIIFNKVGIRNIPFVVIDNKA